MRIILFLLVLLFIGIQSNHEEEENKGKQSRAIDLNQGPRLFMKKHFVLLKDFFSKDSKPTVIIPQSVIIPQQISTTTTTTTTTTTEKPEIDTITGTGTFTGTQVVTVSGEESEELEDKIDDENDDQRLVFDYSFFNNVMNKNRNKYANRNRITYIPVYLDRAFPAYIQSNRRKTLPSKQKFEIEYKRNRNNKKKNH